MNSRCNKALVFGGLLCSLFVTAAAAEVKFTDVEQQAIAAHGPWPVRVPDDPGNELSGLAWAENLGQSLFNNRELSASGTVSCASCHQADKGFSDQRPLGVGAEVGVRNTQGLLNSGLHRWFGWGGASDSLWAASIRPMLASHEMASSLSHASDVLKANAEFVTAIEQHLIDNQERDPKQGQALRHWDDEATVVIAAKAIAAYVRTLTSAVTPFDRYRKALLDGDLNAQQQYPESAKRGLKLFLSEANCRACHFGPNFSNSEFHDIGRPFFTGVGQVDPGRHQGIKSLRENPYSLAGEYGVNVQTHQRLKTENVKLSQANWGQWRTPSLRNLALTAPYMHDGSLKNLRDVVDWYADIDVNRLHAKGESILKPLGLTEQQRNDLVVFLESLSVSSE